MKDYLKAEKECIETCVNALDKLLHSQWKESSGDSVAERKGKDAVVRVLHYIWDLTQQC
jgi:hypothetical protein